ncbi:hypothetical protein T10_5873, partial [Trichinella papuae]
LISDVTMKILPGEIKPNILLNMQFLIITFKFFIGYRGSIHTNLDVDIVLRCAPHVDECYPDNSIFKQLVPQIYSEKACSASADLETAGGFPTYKIKLGKMISLTASNTSAAGNSCTLACYKIWAAISINIFPHLWIESLKLFLIGTSRCSSSIFLKSKLVLSVYCLTVRNYLTIYCEIGLSFSHKQFFVTLRPPSSLKCSDYYHFWQEVLQKTRYFMKHKQRKHSNNCWQQHFCRFMMFLLLWNCLGKILRVL